uniref:Cytochrome c oxidase assembly factor 3 n=1 Tax=Plectus sambesii TaxID=2011161 RepID=A0A914W238_9BILA
MTSKGNSTADQHIEKSSSLNELHVGQLAKFRRQAPDLRVHGRVLLMFAGAAVVGYGVYSIASFFKQLPSGAEQRVHDDMAQYFLHKEVQAKLKQQQQQQQQHK